MTDPINKSSEKECKHKIDITSSLNISGKEIPLNGLKSISSQVFELFNIAQSYTYEEINEKVAFPNPNTLRRRVYDVLTVLRALGFIHKKNKHYVKTDLCLLTPYSNIGTLENNSIDKTDSSMTKGKKIRDMNDLVLHRTMNIIRKRVIMKHNEIKNLVAIRNSLKFIIERNKRCPLPFDKLYAPFVLITTNKNVQVNCETNEERDFFRIQSKEQIAIVDDLAVMKEIYDASGNFRLVFDSDSCGYIS